MANKEEKVVAMNQNNEEQNVNGNPEPEKTSEAPAEKKHPIKDFFGKHGKKIKTGLGIAGAIGIGVAADRLGLKIGAKKSGSDESPAEAE